MKINLHYHWQQYDWEENGRILVTSYDATKVDDSCVLIKVVEVEVPDCDIPARDVVNMRRTAVLQAEKEKLQAETHIKIQAIQAIDDKIRQLSALEYKS
jgi:hypothetical protein